MIEFTTFKEQQESEGHTIMRVTSIKDPVIIQTPDEEEPGKKRTIVEPEPVEGTKVTVTTILESDTAESDGKILKETKLMILIDGFGSLRKFHNFSYGRVLILIS